MPEETMQHPCIEHSGVKGQQKTVIWLLGILIALLVTVGSFLCVTTSSIQNQVAVIPIQLKQLADRDGELKSDIREIDTRLKVVEEKCVQIKIAK